MSAWHWLATLWTALGATAVAAPPIYDHVVIVMEENEDYDDVIGSGFAPYINALAAGGMSLTEMRGITHPSEPNYNELFSGDNQNAVDDSTPVNIPFTAPNLGAALLAAGRTFVGYADGLPAAGNITSDGVNNYYRYHCPWVWWMTNSPTSPNQLPPTLHQPFTAFPTDFTQLPTVAFVIPNNIHNMHDGFVAHGDTWLAQNLQNYATWAKTHNSLLIVTWDESNFTQPNITPTILYGANINPGQSDGSWTLHNLLRTLEDMYGLPPLGRSALVPPISGVFSGEIPVKTKYIRNGLSGYAGTHDTMLASSSPDTSFGNNGTMTVLSTFFQSLIRFDDIFGAGAAQVPPGASIVSAKLILSTYSNSSNVSFSPVYAYRMLVPWSETSTWNNLTAGVSTDNVEAATIPDFAVVPNYNDTAVSFDVTASIRAWIGGADNNGWTLQTASSGDSWVCSTVSGTYRPVLEISYLDGSIVGLTENSTTVDEQAGFATLTVRRNVVAGSGAGTVSVKYSTSKLSASAISDYSSVSGTLTWTAGDITDRFISVPIQPDSSIEGSESFLVTLNNLSAGSLLGANPAATVTITEPPYSNWRFAHFGAAGANSPTAGDLADPDGDGLANLLEYGLASDPLFAEAGLAIGGGTDYLTLAFRRNLSATDVIFTVQASGDLGTWSNGSTYAASGDTSSNAVTTEVGRTPNGATETIVVRDNLPIAAGGPRYLRLNVSRVDTSLGSPLAGSPSVAPVPARKKSIRLHR